MCTNDCSVSPVEADQDCYEPFSSQPTETIEVLNDYDDPNVYGFKSDTHIGVPDVDKVNNAGNLNDPARMIARYKDTDGADDIEAIAFWMRDSFYVGGFGTPVWITDETDVFGQAPNINSWGFMMRKIGEEWVPYIPAYGVTPAKWKRAISVDINPLNPNEFYIKGPTGGNMVAVKIKGITQDALLQEVEMEFELRFSGNDITEKVAEITYQIYLMGLDKFSFTPYDNYDINYSEYWTSDFARYDDTDLSFYWPENKLRYKPEQSQTYAMKWFWTNRRWTIDKTPPTINTDIITDSTNGTIVVEWEASDIGGFLSNLYSIVGDIMYSGDNSDITMTGSTGVTIPYSPTLPQPIPLETFKIGDLPNTEETNVSFYVSPDVLGMSTTHSGSVSIDPGANRDGTLYIYIRVYDDAGNMVLNNDSTYSIQLDDWFVTDGGLAYSGGGTVFKAKNPEEGKVWIDVLPPKSYSPLGSLFPEMADLSSEMWADGLFSLLDSKTLLTNAYGIANHRGTGITDYYSLFMEAYLKNRPTIPNLVELEYTNDLDTDINLTANIVSKCGNKVNCLINVKGKTTVREGFTCNGNAVLFSNSLDIYPGIKNKGENTDSCIFVVNGPVNIYPGSDAEGGTSAFGYDQINAYIYANGMVSIYSEYYDPLVDGVRSYTSKGVDETYDGLYINGGIQSVAGFNQIERYLQFIDRLQYPVLAIDAHPKYGILGETFFGKEVTLQRTEVGIK
jgi:hypothetical protein